MILSVVRTRDPREFALHVNLRIFYVIIWVRLKSRCHSCDK